MQGLSGEMEHCAPSGHDPILPLSEMCGKEQEEKSMKKRRRLRKPIRWTLKGIGYLAAAEFLDLMAMGAALYYFGERCAEWYFLPVVGVCLALNALLWLFVFQGEFERKRVRG